ncbi:MAG: TIGR00645 family protein [Candidatus Nucleicultricaceae bacterium]
MKEKYSTADRILAVSIFSSRWLQAPLYIGLIFAQLIYVYQFILELVHLFTDIRRVNETDIMLVVLGLIDVVMISNLLIMVIIGGYETFVSRLKMDDHPDSPEWLAHVNANTMKIKLSLALIGISSIHLLKTFINIEQVSEKAAIFQVVIHVVFLLSSLALGLTTKLTQDINADH